MDTALSNQLIVNQPPVVRQAWREASLSVAGGEPQQTVRLAAATLPVMLHVNL